MKHLFARAWLRWMGAFSLCSVSLILLAACASTPTPTPTSPVSIPSAMVDAQTLETAAARAYARSDLVRASAQYQQAARLYASLAQVDWQAQALLNQARVQADAGLPDLAVATVRSALDLVALSEAVQTLAHGRLAALLLERDAVTAAQHLGQARALCQAACRESSALHALAARLALLQGDALRARVAAESAAGTAQTPADRANAWRLLAQAALLLPGADLAQAVRNAQAALQLDQNLGVAARVQADLNLLVSLHRARGETAPMQRYEALARGAQAARLALGAHAP